MKKRIIIIGIGEIGCRMAESFSEKMLSSGIRFVSIAVDCDQASLDRIHGPIRLSLSDGFSVKAIAERIGIEAISEWFPCNPQTDEIGYYANVYLDRGTGRVRANGLLAFFRAMNDPEVRTILEKAVDSVFEDEDENSVYELYLAASLSGGTGSALFCPMALYVEEYVRGKYGKELDSRAFLVSPEVIDGVCPYEQKISMRANAYAAIRELEAIDGIAFSDPGSESISFKIGQKNNLDVGMLFDSDNERYHDIKYAPFCAVTILDRIAAMESLNNYYDVWSDMMVCSAKNMTGACHAGEKTRAVYRGLSIRKFRYSPHIFADFVSAKYCESRIDDILRPVAMFEKQFSEYASFHQADKMQQYSKHFPETLRNIDENERGVTSEPDENLVFEKYDTFIRDILSERTDCNLSDSFSDLTKKADEVLDAVRNGSEKKDRKKVAVLCAEAYQQLGKYYADRLKCIYDIHCEVEHNPEILRSRFRCSIRGILEDKERPINPVKAFSRLCEIRNRYSYHEEREEQVRTVGYDMFRWYQDGESPKIPDVFLEMPANHPSRKSRFDRWQKDGFINWIQNGFRESDIVFDDAKIVCSFLNNVKRELDEAFYCILGSELLPFVDEQITAYRSLFTFLPRIKDEMADAAFDLEKNCRAGNMDRSEIGVTPENLNQTFEDYVTVTSDDTEGRNQEYASLSNFLAELFDRRDELSYGAVRTVMMKWRDFLHGRFCGSELYRFLAERNIVSAGLEADRKCRTERDFFSMLKITSNPFSYRVSDDADVSWRPVETNTVYLSEACADRLCATAEDGWSVEKKEKEIGNALATVCDYASNVSVGDSVSDKQILIVREVRGLRAHTISLFDEFDDSCGLFRDFRSALSMMKKYQTVMWNPYLCRPSVSTAGIPFINPEMQRESDRVTGKAFLFGMIYHRFSIGKSECDENRSVFYFHANGEKCPVTERGSEVLTGEPQRIFGWLKGRYDDSCHLAEMLDGCVRECIHNVACRTNFDGFEKTVETVLASEPFSIWAKNIFANVDGAETVEGIVPFASRISETESPYSSMAKGVLSALDEYTNMICSVLGGSDDEMIASEVSKTVNRAYFRSMKCCEVAADPAEIPE